MPRREDFTFERFYNRHDRKDGTTAWYEALAIAFEFDEQLSGRLSALDYDEYHCVWDSEYELENGEVGAWTCDTDTETLAALRERDIPVPETPDEIPVNAESRRINPSQIDRECALCGEASMLSIREVRDTYPTPTTRMRILLEESVDATHLCRSCGEFFECPEYGTQGEERDEQGGTDDSEFNLAEAM